MSKLYARPISFHRIPSLTNIQAVCVDSIASRASFQTANCQLCCVNCQTESKKRKKFQNKNNISALFVTSYEMDSRAIYTKLSSHKIFDIIKDGLKNSEECIKNLLAVKGDVVYLWHAEENCIITLILKSLEDEATDAVHQVRLIHYYSFSSL